MAICINRNGICFGSYSITPAPTGICISGAFSHQGTQVNFSQAQGVTCGYFGAGTMPFSIKWINKFPFASDAPVTSAPVGDFVGIHHYAAGAASSTDGYNIGGYIVNYSPAPVGPIVANSTAIEKFPFASDTNAAHVSLLSTGVIAGYIAGQDTGPPVSSISGTIQKFPFATDSGSSQTGTLTVGRYLGGGHNSFTHGYAVGGRSAPTTDLDTIDKYTFASDSNATDVGELVIDSIRSTPSNSDTNGYVIGGVSLPTNFLDTNTRFPFAADASAADVGEMVANPAPIAACFYCGQGGTGNIQV